MEKQVTVHNPPDPLKLRRGFSFLGLKVQASGLGSPLLALVLFLGVLVTLGVFHFLLRREAKLEDSYFILRSGFRNTTNQAYLDKYSMQLESHVLKGLNTARKGGVVAPALGAPFICAGNVRQDSIVYIEGCRGFDQNILNAAQFKGLGVSREPKSVFVIGSGPNASPDFLVLAFSWRSQVSFGVIPAIDAFPQFKGSAVKFHVLESSSVKIGSERSPQRDSSGDLQTVLPLSLGHSKIWLKYTEGMVPLSLTPAWIAVLVGIGGLGVFLVISFSLLRRNRLITEEVLNRTLELEKVSRAAIEANSAKSTFLASVSHELRTPLNLILGTADLLQETPVSQQQKFYIDSFQRAGRHLLDLINDLLDFQTVDRGEISIVERPMDLLELVEDVSTTIFAKCSKKGLSYSHQIDFRISKTICADSKRIRQIILNLLSNAVRYTEKGSIQLVIGLAEKSIVANDKTLLKIEVKDTGIGIPQNESERVFEEFYRSKKSKRNENHGIGLGLTLVYQFVTRMGGAIRVDSQEGVGSVFTALIPVVMKKEETLLDSFRQRFSGRLGFEKVHLLAPALPGASWQRSIFEAVGVAVELHPLDLVFHKFSILKSIPALNEEGAIFVVDVGQVSWTMEQLKSQFVGISPEISHKIVLILSSGQWANEVSELSEVGIHNLVFSPLRVNEFLEACCQRPRAEWADPAGLRTSGSHGKRRILIVEDDLETRSLFAAYLEDSVYALDFAGNGEEALVQLKRDPSRYGLVLTDLRMPKMDGVALLNELTKLEATGNFRFPPVLVLTADVQSERLQASMQAGARGCLTKPINKADLLASIEEHELRA